MDRAIKYLEAIEDINRAHRRLSERGDARSRDLLASALDAAKAAWLLMPAEFRDRMEPPPERHDEL